MQIQTTQPCAEPHKILFRRCIVDLKTGDISHELVPCSDLEDVLGGFGRSFKLLAKRNVTEAYSPGNPLVVNTGLLTGSSIMTGMRTYFSAYSPLKVSNKGLPAAIWSASSGKFGAQFSWTGLDEIIFENCSDKPVYALVSEGAEGPVVELKCAQHLLGLSSHDKIMVLHKEYPKDAQFAAIGQAGEKYRDVYMGAIALSTEQQLREGEDKCRFAGRGGMGSIMGYKNLIALVARSSEKLQKVTPGIKDINVEIVKGGGSARFQPISQGGNGGTWASYGVLQAFYAVSENNFRPQGNDGIEQVFRENVEKQLHVKSESCFRCGIRCHNNIHRRNPDGTVGEFIAKFDFEPLNLLGTNLGIHDAELIAELIKLADNFGMDAISLGTTIAYLLDYNQRHPERQLCNGATFGQYDKIRELIEEAGKGNLPEIGRGSKRLAQATGEPEYAMHVKGLELPAYLPDTNPGYPWAIAGGHMSMGTYLLLAREGKTDLDYWVNAVARTGLMIVGYDMIGLCKFIGVGINHRLVIDAIREATGLVVSADDITAAVRRAYFLGLALERRQGYGKEEYALPEQVFSAPNDTIKLPRLVTREFFAQLAGKVWELFEPEMPQI